jgi:hypothetical protein
MLGPMKALTRDQVQSRKDQAVRFTRDVLDDSDRADEIEDESLEDYAERRKFTITNPPNKRRTHMADGKTKAELEAQIDDLEAENQDLQDQLDAIADIAGGGDQDDDDSDDDDADDTDDGDGDDLRD